VSPLLALDEAGLACARARVHVDPWGIVEDAILTHAHADHARPVMQRAFVASPGAHLARARLPGVDVVPLAYGERVRMGDVDVSLHPSGHVLGGAQVRFSCEGETWVVSGDYKLARDPTCEPFEPVPCDVFITEATFGLPVFRWDSPDDITREIAQWWSDTAREQRPALAFAYSLGKSARLLASLLHADALSGPVFTHGAIERMLGVYRASGVRLPETTHLAELTGGKKKKGGALPAGALVIGPPSAQNSAWAKKLDALDASTAYCSGWMRIRGLRRRRVVDRGFVLSDHADWPALLEAVRASGASRVLVTHGYSNVLANALIERGIEARPLATQWEGERVEKEGAATDDALPAEAP
jgi:putative mRNA 3-end processing factor